MVEVRLLDLEKPGELEETVAMVAGVFLEFVASDYSAEGIAEFLRFIDADLVRETLSSGERKMWVAVVDGLVAGVMALRSENHICLFFIDKAYHHQGIGHALYEVVREHLRSIGREFVSVYSSRYAIQVYERFGFVQVAEETLIRGMVSTPMCAYIYLPE